MTSSVYLEWIIPKEIEDIKMIHVEMSIDNNQFELIGSYFDLRESLFLDALQNEKLHYFRVNYNTKGKNKIDYSNTLILLPTTGQSIVDDAWILMGNNLEGSMLKFNEVIDRGLSASINAKTGRGWALLKKVNGDETQVENIQLIRNDFFLSLYKLRRLCWFVNYRFT